MGRRDPDEIGPIDPRRIAAVAHRVLADMLREGWVAVETGQEAAVLAFVGRHPATQADAVVYRQATRQRVCSAVAVYFRLFAPEPAWRFVGSEVRVGHNRLDLVWDTPAGVLVDELKAGRTATTLESDKDEAQAHRYLAAAAAEWGERFLGLRWLMLGAPGTSLFIAPGGERKPI